MAEWNLVLRAALITVKEGVQHARCLRVTQHFHLACFPFPFAVVFFFLIWEAKLSNLRLSMAGQLQTKKLK